MGTRKRRRRERAGYTRELVESLRQRADADDCDANTTAALNLAATYQGLSRYRDAVQWFRRALAAGDSSSLLEVAKAELSGIGTRRNVPAAFARLRRLAAGVSHTAPFERTEALLLMADAFRSGWIVRRDYPQAIRLLRRAASLGSDAAKGLLLDNGFDHS